MSRTVLALLISILGLTSVTSAAEAQSKPKAEAAGVKLNEQKAVLTRTGDEERASGRPTEFVIRHPRAEGATEVTDAINATLDPRKFGASADEFVFEDSIATGFGYVVTYNASSLLSVEYTLETMGAYPEVHVSRVVIDLRTGKPLKATDVFKPSSLRPLAELVDAAMQAEIRKTIEAKGEIPDLGRFLSAELNDKHFQPENLDDFSLSDKGVTFHYNYDFPHVAKGAQPAGVFQYSFKQLAPYIAPDGPLGQLRGR